MHCQSADKTHLEVENCRSLRKAWYSAETKSFLIVGGGGVNKMMAVFVLE